MQESALEQKKMSLNDTELSNSMFLYVITGSFFSDFPQIILRVVARFLI